MARHERGTVLLDMDNTSYDLNGGLATRLGEMGLTLARDITTFYAAESVPEQAELIEHVIAEPDFFYRLPVMRGLQQRVRELQASGYHVIFCSSPSDLSPTCEDQKRAAIERDFDPSMAAEAIIQKDKTVAEGVVLVDDKPLISGSVEPSWTHVLLTQPWNAKVGRGRPRLENWLNPAEVQRVIAKFAGR